MFLLLRPLRLLAGTATATRQLERIAPRAQPTAEPVLLRLHRHAYRLTPHAIR